MAQTTYTVDIDLRMSAAAAERIARLGKRALELNRSVGGLVPSSIAQSPSIVGPPKDRPLFVIRSRGKNRFELRPTRRLERFDKDLKAWIQQLQAAGRRQKQQEKTIMGCGGKGKGKGNGGPKMPKGGKGKGKGK